MTQTTLAAPLWKEMRQQMAGADEILRRLQIESPPVSVEAIVQRLGILVVPVANPGWSGAVQADEKSGRAVIWVNSLESAARNRFTLAHEVGHLLRHPLTTAFRDVTFNGSPQELEANRFAAELLMPFYMLDPVVTRLSVGQLARAFFVSESAMEMRVREYHAHLRTR